MHASGSFVRSHRYIDSHVSCKPPSLICRALSRIIIPRHYFAKTVEEARLGPHSLNRESAFFFLTGKRIFATISYIHIRDLSITTLPGNVHGESWALSAGSFVPTPLPPEPLHPPFCLYFAPLRKWSRGVFALRCLLLLRNPLGKWLGPQAVWPN